MSGMPRLPDPEEVQKAFDKWWKVVSSIVSTLATALLALKLSPPWNYVLAATLTLCGVVVALWLHHRQKHVIEPPPPDAPTVDAIAPTADVTFRRLRKYGAGDTLPGVNRHRLAINLKGAILASNFRVGIVTGESGAGKSSLIESALIPLLKAAQFDVLFESNISARLPGEMNETIMKAILAERWNEIERELEGARTPASLGAIVVLDQVEELLTRLRSEASREAFGDLLNRSLARKHRIVLSIRKEYLAELRDVVQRLEAPVSLRDTFMVRNFEPAEAVQVILECAKRDRLRLDDRLPEWIANDLTLDGTVRPADLQIVCDALRGDLTEDNYLASGRAVGLRSRYIKETIELAGDVRVVKAVLRQLCDIPGNKKRPEALTTAVIAEAVRLGAAGSRATDRAVAAVLDNLYKSYVVVKGMDEPPRWSLIHDYLVEPIKIATEEDATRAEAASAELEYFLSQEAAHRIRSIPLDRLKAIRANVPPALLSQPRARSLVRRSTLWGYGRPAMAAMGVAAGSVAAVMLLATEWDVWDQPGPAASHWEKRSALERRDVRAQWLSKERGLIYTFEASAFRTKSIVAWDVRTGRRLAGFSREALTPVGETIWFLDGGRLGSARFDPLKAAFVESMAPKVASLPRNLRFGGWEEGFDGTNLTFLPGFDMTGDVSRIVVNLASGAQVRVMKQDLVPRQTDGSSIWGQLSRHGVSAELVESSGHERLTVWPAGYRCAAADLESETHSSRLLGMRETGEGAFVLHVATAKGVDHLSIQKDSSACGFTLASRTSSAIPPDLASALDRGPAWNIGVQVIDLETTILVVDRQDTRSVIWPLDPATGEVQKPLFSLFPMLGRQDSSVVIWVPEKNELDIWSKGAAAPLLVHDIELRDNDAIELNADGTRALVTKEEGRAQLWAIDRGEGRAKVLATVDLPDVSGVQFTSDEQAIIVRQRGGLVYGWTTQGRPLGALAHLGSDVIWSRYDDTCGRILIWTKEGQRLDLRRGNRFPILGFRPRSSCTAPSAAAASAVAT